LIVRVDDHPVLVGATLGALTAIFGAWLALAARNGYGFGIILSGPIFFGALAFALGVLRGGDHIDTERLDINIDAISLIAGALMGIAGGVVGLAAGTLAGAAWAYVRWGDLALIAGGMAGFLMGGAIGWALSSVVTGALFFGISTAFLAGLRISARFDEEVRHEIRAWLLGALVAGALGAGIGFMF
jgi:hypothetical protein